MDLSRCGIEVFELKFSNFSPVHGVGILGIEPGDIELHHAASDFLVGSKTDADGAVLEFGMGNNILHGIHDFSHTGLVVSTQQSSAVCRDDGFPLMTQQFRELRRLE